MPYQYNQIGYKPSSNQERSKMDFVISEQIKWNDIPTLAIILLIYKYYRFWVFCHNMRLSERDIALWRETLQHALSQMRQLLEAERGPGQSRQSDHAYAMAIPLLLTMNTPINLLSSLLRAGFIDRRETRSAIRKPSFGPSLQRALPGIVLLPTQRDNNTLLNG